MTNTKESLVPDQAEAFKENWLVQTAVLAFSVAAFLTLISRDEISGTSAIGLLLFGIAIPLLAGALMVSLISKQYGYSIYPWYRSILDFGGLLAAPSGIAMVLWEYSVWHVAGFLITASFSSVAVFIFAGEIKNAEWPTKTNK